MTPEQRSILSEYRQLTSLNAEHGVYLVQNVQSGKLYVQKTLVNYQADIFSKLKEDPVPHMPRIMEALEDSGRLIVIESYVSGRTLQEIIKTDGPLSVTEALRIGLQLCGILKELHAKGIIHRDIKPSNVIVSEDGAVNLLDLDAAKIYKAQEKQDTRLIGTHGFAAPEQYGFGASSPVTDIYAVGVLLNTLVSGSFSNTANTSDASLNAVIERCIRMDPAKRYQSAGSLENALKKVPASRLRRKSRIPLLCAAFLLLLLFAVIRPFQKHAAPSVPASGSSSSTVPADAGRDTTAAYPSESIGVSQSGAEISSECTSPVSPELSAIVRGENTGINHLNPVGGGLSAIIDTVYCGTLQEGKEYVIKGTLMNKVTGSPVTIKGKTVTDEVRFTPSKSEKTADLCFRFDASAVAGSILVVYEIISDGGTEVLVHADLNDESKTVYIPKLTTRAVAGAEDIKMTAAGKNTTIIDTLFYEGLEIGREYTVSGWLCDQESGKDLLTGGVKEDPAHGNAVLLETSFIPPSSSGSVELTYEFDATLLSGKIIAVFEELKTDGKTVAAHCDINDWDQMILIPEMISDLSVSRPEPDGVETTNVLLKDTIILSPAELGGPYYIEGILLNKASGEPVLIDGEKVTAQASFYVAGSGLSVKNDLFFLFDASSLFGTEVAVMESVYYKDVLLFSHGVISDEDPSVILQPWD